MGKDDELGTGLWDGFGNMGHGLKTDWARARSTHEAFKAAEKVRHKERLAERKIERMKRANNAPIGAIYPSPIGPPDPRKGRLPMTR